jgi:pectin methylesterase-like acyl-CoA thioesterase
MACDRFFSTRIGLLILAATGLVSSTTPALAASKIVVDDDRVQCPQAEFTTIQSAIDSLGANPTGTITVCAGSYKESITVGRGASRPRDPRGTSW